jgi:zinc D-Ala-D-Ala carboxypeptidase
MARNLTAHFTLEEFCISQEAVRAGIDNTPSAAVVANLVRLARMMEKIRVVLKKPIYITSGYRSAALNARIGGSRTSAHMDGRAADFICPAFGTPYQVAKKIVAARLGFDQMIHEYGRWVHIAVPRAREPAQRELLSIFQPGRYLAGLTETA